MCMHNRIIILMALAFTALWGGVFLNGFTAPAYAQTDGVSLVVTQPLSFGEAVVSDNSRQYFIDARSDGTFLADNVFIFLQPPQEGIYQFTGLPPSTVINNISITVEQQMIGPGEDFIIDNFDIEAPESSDINGELVVRVGAFIRTTGSNRPYGFSARFESAMVITVDF